MPTRTNDNPFAPRGPLSREQLERYARGALSPAEQHEVELHLERDPLLRDAAEGLAMPGTTDALGSLSAHRPSPQAGGTTKAWVIGGVVVALIAATFWWLLGPTELKVPTAVDPAAGRTPTTELAGEQAALAQELTVAVALPESLRSGVGRTEPFQTTAPTGDTTVREDGPVRMEPRTIRVERPAEDADLLPAHGRGGSRRLMFLHDLKLVHPAELYRIDQVSILANGSVDPRFGDASSAGEDQPTDGRAVPYERYFDAAMARFASGDRRGCLEDLLLVLDQHPDDVNALFYAGLCSRDLGLFPRAADLLERARRHEVDTFVEEAEWYHALAVEQWLGEAAARPLLDQVVARDGYYATRARKHLAEIPGK